MAISSALFGASSSSAIARSYDRVVDDGDVYAVIGEEGFQRLVGAFYAQVPGDDILGPMYPPDDLAGSEERLRLFLIGRFGGPATYMEKRGHPRLRMRHAPFRLDEAARNRWVQLMDRALDEAGLPAEAVQVLRPFFHEVATFLRNT
jgi:hemoglobin